MGGVKRKFTFVSLNVDRLERVQESCFFHLYAALYKIPIEFAMLEIINCIILWGYASSFKQPPQRKPSEKREISDRQWKR